MTDETSTTDPVQKAIDEDLEESSNWFYYWWMFYIVLIAFMGLGYWTAPSTFPTYYTHIMHASFINAILGVLGIVGLMVHATTGTLRPPSFKPPAMNLSLIHISEPTRLGMSSYAVFCLKKKKKT